ncbi:MAG: branched-chain amino acid ABC transporter permease [Alphaproteobacteria bacterium]|nr:branched-chain amino acid ABC transporter permease [Alphaproteobacteria bacterium]
MTVDVPAIIVSGVVLASLYAMMATGLALVWNTLGIFNFAHGIFMTLGAYIAWTISDEAGLGWGLAGGFAIAVATMIGGGLATYGLLVKPFQNRKDIVLVVVMTTLAGSFFLENTGRLIWGPRLKQLQRVVEGTVQPLGVSISAHELVIIISTPLILLALYAFLRWTRTGSAIRAIAQNQDSALLIGINVPRLYALSFALSAGLAGLAGALLGGIRFIVPNMGSEPLLKAFIVVIFGGLGSLGGTIVGAYVIGLIESTSTYFVGIYWTNAVMFAIFIFILIFRPTGLFGRN